MSQAEQEAILQLQGISKRFGAVQVLTEVDFEVYPGEVVGLVGDNGVGAVLLIGVTLDAYTRSRRELTGRS